MSKASNQSTQGVVTENAQAQRNALATEAHDPNLTHEEFTLLNSLEHVSGTVDRAMFAQAETVLDEKTVASLHKYAHTFEVMGVPVGDAVANIDDAEKLMELKKRLDLANAVVQRQLAVKLAPIAAAASSVHAVLASLPEGSPMLDAFNAHMEAWQKLYGKGGRPAKAVVTPADPVTPR